MTISWLYPVRIYSAEIVSSSPGDTVTIHVGESTNIGNISVAVVALDTVITVSQSVIDNIFIGAEVELTEGATTDSMGIVIDITGLTITCSIASVNAFTTAAFVLMTSVICKDVEITQEDLCIGKSILGSSLIPSNTEIKLIYTNNSVSSQHVVAYIQLVY